MVAVVVVVVAVGAGVSLPAPHHTFTVCDPGSEHACFIRLGFLGFSRKY